MLITGWSRIRLAAIALYILICMMLLAACNYTGLDVERSNADLLTAAVANTRAAGSYHLTLRNTGIDGQTSLTTGEIDAENDRSRFEISDAEPTTEYILIGNDTFVSDDGGQTFFDGADRAPVVEILSRQLGDFNPEEAAMADDALRNGNPAIDSIDGVMTKHIVASYADLPSLIMSPDSGESPAPNTLDIWVTLGPKPVIRRVKIGDAGDNSEAGITFDWSNLGEPVTIEAPKVTEVDNVDLLKKAAANMEGASSYELEADLLQGDTNINLSGEMDVANDNSRLDIDTGGIAFSLVTVDGEAYMSMDNGKTYIQTTMAEQLLSSLSMFTQIWDSFRFVDLKQGAASIKNGSPATELVDGVRTKHIIMSADAPFSLTSSGAPDEPSATMDLWISIGAEPYIRQMMFSGIVDGQRIDGTFKWSRFNEELEIEAPPVDSYVPPTPAREKPTRITLSDFKALYDNPAKRPLILDVRSKELYEEGHIVGAVSFPESEVDVRVHELPKDRLIVAYCQ